jgi:hypothetical protein
MSALMNRSSAVSACSGKNASPSRGADHGRLALEHHRLPAAVEDACRQVAREFPRIGAAENDRELVAAEPGDGASAVDGRAQPVADLDEQGVAGAVTERIVDRLEAVEIEDEEGQLLLCGAGGGNPGVEGGIEGGTVGEPGQRIAIGQHFQPVVGAQDVRIGTGEGIGKRRRLQFAEHVADERRLAGAAAADQHHRQCHDVDGEEPAAGAAADGKRGHHRDVGRYREGEGNRVVSDPHQDRPGRHAAHDQIEAAISAERIEIGHGQRKSRPGEAADERSEGQHIQRLLRSVFHGFPTRQDRGENDAQDQACDHRREPEAGRKGQATVDRGDEKRRSGYRGIGGERRGQALEHGRSLCSLHVQCEGRVDLTCSEFGFHRSAWAGVPDQRRHYRTAAIRKSCFRAIFLKPSCLS